MFEHLIGPLSPRMVPVRDPDYHHQKSKVLAEVKQRKSGSTAVSRPQTPLAMVF